MLGNNIRFLRTKAKLSLKELGDQVGCSKGHLHGIEKSQKDVGFMLGCKLAKALKVRYAQHLVEKDLSK